MVSLATFDEQGPGSGDKQKGIISIVVNPGWVQTDMGGSKASLTPEQSVRGTIENVVNTITIEDTGEFFQWDGSHHPR